MGIKEETGSELHCLAEVLSPRRRLIPLSPKAFAKTQDSKITAKESLKVNEVSLSVERERALPTPGDLKRPKTFYEETHEDEGLNMHKVFPHEGKGQLKAIHQITQSIAPTAIPSDIGKLHEEILRRLDTNVWKQLSSPEDVETWISSLGDWAGPLRQSLSKPATGAKYPTLLHRILVYKTPNGRNSKFKKRAVLARYLMREYPDLYKGRQKLVKDHGGSDDNGKKIDDDDDDDDDDEDDDENTPLHVALTKAIKLATFDKRNSEPTIDPFLQLFVEENPVETAAQLEQWHRDSSNGVAGPCLHDLLPRIWSPDASTGLRCIVEFLTCLGPRLLASRNKEGNTVLHLVARYSLSYDQKIISEYKLYDLVVDMIQRYPRAVNTINAASESPYLHRIHSAHQKNLRLKDEITMHLKKCCIAYEPEEACRLLYGAGPSEQHMSGKHIFLDLIGLQDQIISENRLKRFLDRLQPDDVLKYVRIPHFVVTQTDNVKTPNSHQQSTIMKSSGRLGTEMEPSNNCHIVFGHLAHRKPNPVRAILDIAVDDISRERPPHQNVAITSCLRPFSQTIETWDWRKIDMCTDTILEAAPLAKEIYLYCSGNNVVLKGWASLDGLPKFSKLERVHLKICDEYVVESNSCIDKSVQHFKDRLLENYRTMWKRSIIIKPDTSELKDSNQGLQHVLSPEENLYILPANSWLCKMDKFASFINDAPTPPHEQRRIKVAVLDDGFDLIENIDLFAENHIIGKAFNTVEAQTTKDWSNRFPGVEYFSEGGHGTLMAQNIRRICPQVDFYIAKLQNIANRPGEEACPTAESAVAAINWAIANHVDIISMSWTIKQTDERCLLHQALDKASRAGILLFGASSDQGHNAGSNAYLYPAMHDKVFCIGAADASGNLGKRVGPEADYAFPGGDGQVECQESSKFATALAAGLAALILHCAEYIDYGEDEEIRDRLRQHSTMNRVFEGMRGAGQTKYLSVASYFNESLYHHGWDFEGRAMFANMVKSILTPLSIETGHRIA